MFEVKIDDLKPGVFYLARDRNHDTFHFQGIFEGIYKGDGGLRPSRHRGRNRLRPDGFLRLRAHR